MKPYTVIGLLCVAALFAAAMLFPEYYNSLYDQNMLNQPVFTDVTVSTYETSYDSFIKKLHAMAKVQCKGGRLRAVRTNELELSMDKNQLTKILRKELKKMKEQDVLDLGKKPQVKHLVCHERYTIYAPEDDEGMKGISCWKLVYENSRRDITVYLDEEYHKIYYLEIRYKETNPQKSVSQSDGVELMRPSYDSAVWGDAGAYEWDRIVQYYDMESYQDGTCSSWLTTNEPEGIIEFDEQYQIRLGSSLLGEEGELVYRFGIPVEEMIQF